MNFSPNMVFLNRSFDKKRLKSLLLWFRLNLSEGAALEAVEILQGLGFRSATQGAISLGLDDLKTPASKGGRVFQAQLDVSLAYHEHHRGNRTPVELFQHLVDTWHRTSQDLTAEVVQLFHSTERVNPVYMMAFSGARGNLSQVRQLVAMRGLMADPRGQIVGFPILSNFREGLTITEYFVSCYGARKGVVDTAIRTADAGYLTRRLADVSHHFVVRTTNCGTHRTICLRDIKEGEKTILPLVNRLVGRVLGEHISKIASRNEEITPALAPKLASQCDKVFVRSPLSCSLRWGVCQLCYGWGLSEGRRVTLGEAVGIIAAQSIGEPGTQLTLRTFHTGGVFSGDLLNEIRAPYNGIIFFPEPLQGLLVRTPHGQIAFLAKVFGKMFVLHDVSSIIATDSIDHDKFSSLVQPVQPKAGLKSVVKSSISNQSVVKSLISNQPKVAMIPPIISNQSRTTQHFDKKKPDIHKDTVVDSSSINSVDLQKLSIEVSERKKVEFSLQPSTVIFVRQKEQVHHNQLLAEFSSSTLQPINDQIEVTQQVLSETAGQVWFKEIQYGNRRGPGSGSLGTHFSSEKLGGIWVLAGKPKLELLVNDRKQLSINFSTLVGPHLMQDNSQSSWIFTVRSAVSKIRNFWQQSELVNRKVYKTSLVNLEHDHESLKYHYSLGYLQSINFTFSDCNKMVSIYLRGRLINQQSINLLTKSIKTADNFYLLPVNAVELIHKKSTFANPVHLKSRKSALIGSTLTGGSSAAWHREKSPVNWCFQKKWKIASGLLLAEPFFANKEKIQGQFFWLSSNFLQQKQTVNHTPLFFCNPTLVKSVQSKVAMISPVISNHENSYFINYVNKPSSFNSLRFVFSTNVQPFFYFVEGYSFRYLGAQHDYRRYGKTQKSNSFATTRYKSLHHNNNIGSSVKNFTEGEQVDKNRRKEKVVSNDQRNRFKAITKNELVLHDPLDFFFQQRKLQNVPVIKKIVEPLTLNRRHYSTTNRVIFSPVNENYTCEKLIALLNLKIPHFFRKNKNVSLALQLLQRVPCKIEDLKEVSQSKAEVAQFLQRINHNRNLGTILFRESIMTTVLCSYINSFKHSPTVQSKTVKNGQRLVNARSNFSVTKGSYKRITYGKKSGSAQNATNGKKVELLVKSLQPLVKSVVKSSISNQSVVKSSISNQSVVKSLISNQPKVAMISPEISKSNLLQHKAKKIEQTFSPANSCTIGANNKLRYYASLKLLTFNPFWQPLSLANYPNKISKNNKSKSLVKSVVKSVQSEIAMISPQISNNWSNVNSITNSGAFMAPSKLLTEQLSSQNKLYNVASNQKVRFLRHNKRKGKRKTIFLQKPIWLSVNIDNINFINLIESIDSWNVNQKFKKQFIKSIDPLQVVSNAGQSTKYVERNDSSLDQHIVHTITLPLVSFPYIIPPNCANTRHNKQLLATDYHSRCGTPVQGKILPLIRHSFWEESFLGETNKNLTLGVLFILLGITDQKVQNNVFAYLMHKKYTKSLVKSLISNQSLEPLFANIGLKSVVKSLQSLQPLVAQIAQISNQSKIAMISPEISNQLDTANNISKVKSIDIYTVFSNFNGNLAALLISLSQQWSQDVSVQPEAQKFNIKGIGEDIHQVKNKILLERLSHLEKQNSKPLRIELLELMFARTGLTSLQSVKSMVKSLQSLQPLVGLKSKISPQISPQIVQQKLPFCIASRRERKTEDTKKKLMQHVKCIEVEHNNVTQIVQQKENKIDPKKIKDVGSGANCKPSYHKLVDFNDVYKLQKAIQILSVLQRKNVILFTFISASKKKIGFDKLPLRVSDIHFVVSLPIKTITNLKGRYTSAYLKLPKKNIVANSCIYKKPKISTISQRLWTGKINRFLLTMLATPYILSSGLKMQHCTNKQSSGVSFMTASLFFQESAMTTVLCSTTGHPLVDAKSNPLPLLSRTRGKGITFGENEARKTCVDFDRESQSCNGITTANTSYIGQSTGKAVQPIQSLPFLSSFSSLTSSSLKTSSTLIIQSNGVSQTEIKGNAVQNKIFGLKSLISRKKLNLLQEIPQTYSLMQRVVEYPIKRPIFKVKRKKVKYQPFSTGLVTVVSCLQQFLDAPNHLQSKVQHCLQPLKSDADTSVVKSLVKSVQSVQPKVAMISPQISNQPVQVVDQGMQKKSVGIVQIAQTALTSFSHLYESIFSAENVKTHQLKIPSALWSNGENSGESLWLKSNPVFFHNITKNTPVPNKIWITKKKFTNIQQGIYLEWYAFAPNRERRDEKFTRFFDAQERNTMVVSQKETSAQQIINRVCAVSPGQLEVTTLAKDLSFFAPPVHQQMSPKQNSIPYLGESDQITFVKKDSILLRNDQEKSSPITFWQSPNAAKDYNQLGVVQTTVLNTNSCATGDHVHEHSSWKTNYVGESNWETKLMVKSPQISNQNTISTKDGITSSPPILVNTIEHSITNLQCLLQPLQPLQSKSCILPMMQKVVQYKMLDQTITKTKHLFPGQLVAYGENIDENIATTESGQILYVDLQKIILRKAQTVLIYSQAILSVLSREWITKGTPLMALSYQKLVTGDIVQGFPKIEQFFEAPLLKDGTFWSDSLQAKLNLFFQEHREKLPLAEAVRKGFLDIQRVLVEGVQRVYISQGVLIADKHLEVIVRQMTFKGRILYSGDTGFLRNELVALDKIESVNQVTYGQKALYHPQVRGITDASLESESFLSAASFQETTRVLSRDAIIGKTDLMRGLKERVIVGELIQAGTGLANNNLYSLLPDSDT